MTDASARGAFALKVQLLATAAERVLVLGHVAGLRNGDGWFSPGDVNALAEVLRLPRLGNVSESLRRIETRFLVRRHSSGGWSLTPLGQQTTIRAVGRIDAARVDAAYLSGSGAELAHARWPLIPPEFAPQQWVDAISRAIDVHPFESTVFCMTRYAGESDPIGQLIPILRKTLGESGLVLRLASDQKIVDDLWSNVAAHMWASKFGIALFEKRAGSLNQNLLIEVGAMLATGRRCLLLKDPDVSMPTDFIGQIYDEADLGDPAAVRAAVRRWVTTDLALD